MKLQKQFLQANLCFSSARLFEDIDSTKKGYINAEDLENFFAQQPEVENIDFIEILGFLMTGRNERDENVITLQDLQTFFSA